MIVATGTFVAALVVLLCVLLFLDAEPPGVDEAPPVLGPVSMQVLFVAMHDQLVIDGLLDIPPAPKGIPTTWALKAPDDPVLAAAVLHSFERWADEGGLVDVDLSRSRGPHASVGFARGGVTVRVSALPRGVRLESS